MKQTLSLQALGVTDPPSRCGPGVTLLAGCALAMALVPAQAVTTTWIAAGNGGGNWEVAANWSAGVPQALDLVVVAPLTRPLSSVVINAPTTIAGLTLANVNMRVAAALTVTGGVAWDETTALPGVLTFSNGSTVQFQGQLTLTGNASKAVNNVGLLDLSGPTFWMGNTQADGNTLAAGATTTGSVIRSRGTFFDANGFDASISGRGAFDNQGSYMKTGASVTRMDVADFRNSGSVNIAAGSLIVPTMSGAHTGSWQVGAGAVLDFSGGTPTLLGNTGGAGTLRISGGTVTVEGFGHNLAMVLDGGTLAGSFQVLDGAVTWRAGTLAGSGATQFTSALTLEGAGAKTIASGRQVITYGQTTWSGAQLLTIGDSAGSLPTSFINTGEFLDTDSGPRSLRGTNAQLSSFVNAGTYTKTGTGITTVQALAFDNQGTLDIRAGLMRLVSGLTNTGTIHTAAGAGLLDMAGTPLENKGTLAGDGAIDAVASIINRGLITPGESIGQLTLGSLTLASEGAIRIELAAAGASDLLKLTGTVALGGELELWNAGYAPQLGDSFTVLQFGSRQGVSGFDALELHGFATGVAFDVVYGVGDVKVVVTAVPEPGTCMLLLAGLAVVAGLARKRSRVGRAMLA